MWNELFLVCASPETDGGVRTADGSLCNSG